MSLSQNTKKEEFLIKFSDELKNPLHKRIVEAYKGTAPVPAMEEELGKILMEITYDEN